MIDAVERSDGTACCARGEGKGAGGRGALFGAVMLLWSFRRLSFPLVWFLRVGQCRTEWKLHDVSPFPNAVWQVSVASENWIQP